MPIPSLPIELVGEIASHLRAPPQGDTKEAIESGQALSLVCRRWYPIGQALRWRQIQIDFKAIPTLTAHFAVHPALGCLVSSFTHTYRRDESAEEEGSEAGKIQGLAKLIEVMVALVDLKVRCPNGSDYKGVLIVASRLPQLQHASLRINGNVVWTPELATVFAAGFPSLLKWSFTTRTMQLENIDSVPVTHPTELKHLQVLGLRWKKQTLTSSLVQSFTSSIDTLTLKRCTLWGSSANSTMLQWLSTCPHLLDLTLSPTPETFADFYFDLLSRLPSMSSLEYLSINPNDDFITASPRNLSSMLAIIPANLELFRMRSMVFVDWEAFEQRPLPLVKVWSSIGGLIEDSAGTRPTVIWQEEKGAKWYRDPTIWDDWDEFDNGQSLSLVVSLDAAHSSLFS